MMAQRQPRISAADEAQEARTRLDRALASTGDCLWDWDLGTGGVWFDERLATLLGTDQDLPRTFAAFQARLHADERVRFVQAVRRHLEQQQPFDLECRLRAGDDAWRWIRIRGLAQRDATGRPLRMTGFLADVTARRAREASLRHSEEFLRRTLDSVQLAVGVLNAAGELIEINRAWREDASADGLTGLRFCFGENYASLCRNAAARCAAGPAAADGIDAVLRGERPAFLLTYEVTHDEARRALQLRVQPIDMGAGLGAIVTHEDVTELETAHETVRQTKEFYELILDSVPIHIAYVNRERELHYANRVYEEWFGLPASVIHGRRLEDLMSPENYRQSQPRIEAVLAGKTVEFASRVRREAQDRELQVTYLPHAPDGEVAGFFAVASDVTAQRQLEADLRHAQKMEAIGQLTGGIAHDFNNLLSVVIGNLQLLERPLQAQPKLAALAGTALKAALRGADLTRRLLAFARQQVLEPRQVNVNRLVRGMLDLVQRTIGVSIEVTLELTSDIWAASLDPGQLENTLLNLAINARDAMPQGGRLTIVTANRLLTLDDPARHPKLSPGRYIELSVIDTGCGMPPEVAKRAFEPFFTTKQLGKGTGLGLSMVYGFCEQSGGIAALDSEPGRGTRVSLFFPSSEIAGSTASEADTVILDLPRGTETVLLVEPDAEVRSTTAAALAVLGYRVLECPDRVGALDQLAGESGTDLLLCDLGTPTDPVGLRLAEAAHSRLPGLRLLLTSALAAPSAPDHGLPAGCQILFKPYAIGDLAARVRAVLDEPVADPQASAPADVAEEKADHAD
jgi:PAS domain S-box-containing protein